MGRPTFKANEEKAHPDELLLKVREGDANAWVSVYRDAQGRLVVHVYNATGDVAVLPGYRVDVAE